MSSPFSKAFNAKNPMSPMDRALVGKQNRLPEHLQEAIKAAPEMKESPYHKHGKLEKQLEILKNDPELAVKKGLSTEGQGGKDYEAISRLEAQIKQKKAKHSSQRTEEDDMQAREDEDAARGSAVEMSAIKKKSAPLNASYANPQDYFYVSNAADFQNLQDNIASNTAKVLEAQGNPEKQADRLQKRIDKREERKKDPKGLDKLFGTTASNRFDELTEKLKTRRDDAKSRITNTNTELEECIKAGGTYSNGKCS